jgi:hypothetical protein
MKKYVGCLTEALKTFEQNFSFLTKSKYKDRKLQDLPRTIKLVENGFTG